MYKTIILNILAIGLGWLLGSIHWSVLPIPGRVFNLGETYLCKNNEGVKDISRSLFQPDFYIFRCNNGMRSESLSVRLKPKSLEGERE